MDDEMVSTFISHLMQDELAPAIPYTVAIEKAHAFGLQVLDRFRNPNIKHLWLNITVQYSSKMKMRSLPVLQRHYQQTDATPELFALGFAAYIFFMKITTVKDGKYYGERAGELYWVQDEQAESFYKRWQEASPESVVTGVLSDVSFWGTDLQLLPGFSQAVTDKLKSIMANGVQQELELLLASRIITA
jgi:tagaturonate reductase